MRKLPKKELKGLFVAEVAKGGGICTKSNPFVLKMGDLSYYLFIKNISPAYFKNNPDITRIQLPTSNRFKVVIDSKLDFIILGYDLENDVFVSWDPYKIKDRLNTRRNISLYSRLSLQSEVSIDQFKESYLSNGDKIVMFKRERLNDFFLIIDELFNEVDLPSKGIDSKDEIDNDNMNIEEIKKIINPLLIENKVLQAVVVLENKYKNVNIYKDLKFKDWFDIVISHYNSLNNT